MQLNKVKYDELNDKQKENYNYSKVSSALAEYGYNCIKLADDYKGADFITSLFGYLIMMIWYKIVLSMLTIFQVNLGMLRELIRQPHIQKN